MLCQDADAYSSYNAEGAYTAFSENAPDAIVHKPSTKLSISPLSNFWEAAFGNSVFIASIA